jgi:hypothetical protein
VAEGSTLGVERLGLWFWELEVGCMSEGGASLLSRFTGPHATDHEEQEVVRGYTWYWSKDIFLSPYR